jgi:hypothetical protein
LVSKNDGRSDERDAAGTLSPDALIFVAAWGACLGWVLACVAVIVAKTGVLPFPALLGSASTPKGLEKLFYVAFYLLGSVSAFLLTYHARRFFRNGVAAAVGVLIFVPFAPQLAAAVIDGGPFAFVPALPPLDPQKWESFSRHVVPLAYWIALPPVALAVSWFFAKRKASAPVASALPVPESKGFSRTDGWWLAGSVALMAACLFPLDLETVTARIGYNMHDVSFFVAPALFFWGHGLIPGVDFFPQYGIGIGYLFSFFLRPTAAATIANAVLVTAGLSAFYFASALWVLRRLYRSRVYATVVVLFALLLTFHTSMTPLGVFLDPSAWPARYPFLFVFILLFARAVDSRRQSASLAVAGAAAGLCLFWNTETGLYATASATLATILLRGGAGAIARNLAAFAGGTVLAFFALSVLAYGPGIFQPAFLTGLIKPMTIYTEGYGAFLIVWQSPLNIIYAVLSPIIGFATMGWSATLLLRGNPRYGRRTLVVLFLLSMLGNGLMLKWLNMSFDALWHVNALPILAVMAWWVRVAFDFYAARVAPVRIALAQAALIAALLIFLGVVQDARNPSNYGLRAFSLYPSVLIGAFHPQPHQQWDPSQEAAPADIALIDRCTSPHDQAMVVGMTDWVYLLASHRPPKMPWLPSPTIVAFPFLLGGAMHDAGPIYLEGDAATAKFGEPLDSALAARLHLGYRLGATGKTLEMYSPPAGLSTASADHAC